MRVVDVALILSLAALGGVSAEAATKFVPKFNEAGVPEARFAPRNEMPPAETAENLGTWTGSAEIEVIDDEAVITFTLRRVLPETGEPSPQSWRLVWRLKLPPKGSATI